MKILVTSKRINSGGAERMAVIIANGLLGRGHQVGVLASLQTGKDFNLEDGIDRFHVPVLDNNGQKNGSELETLKRIRAVVSEYKPNVIIGVMEEWTFRIWLACLGLGIKIISTDHNAFERPESHSLTKRERFFKFYSNYLYSALTVLTQADAKLLNGRFKHTYVMPNPTTFKALETVPTKSAKVVLAVGRTYDWYVKGFDLLIRAFGEIAKDFPQWKLRIVGGSDSGADSPIFAIIRERGIRDQVEFVNFTPNVIDEYRNAEIFCLSSRYEGFGLVLVEAMSQGCACIACDYKGRQREIITSDSEGICIEADNEELLAQSLRKMMSDNEYRQIARLGAIKRARELSLEKYMDKWENILGSI